jgi:hypothetical protein
VYCTEIDFSAEIPKPDRRHTAATWPKLRILNGMVTVNRYQKTGGLEWDAHPRGFPVNLFEIVKKSPFPEPRFLLLKQIIARFPDGGGFQRPPTQSGAPGGNADSADN